MPNRCELAGVHNFAYRYGEGEWQGLFFRNVHGTADQPITIRGMPGAQIRNTAPDGSEMPAIYILQSSHFVVEDLDVSSHGSAIVLAETQNATIRNNYIHDADGSAFDNLSGLYLSGVTQVLVENILFMDNYDRIQPGNQNNRHIVLFGQVQIAVLKQWTNLSKRSDVNNDGQISALDALLVINVLNAHDHASTELFPVGEQAQWAMVDVNADGMITVFDALIVILDLL